MQPLDRANKPRHLFLCVSPRLSLVAAPSTVVPFGCMQWRTPLRHYGLCHIKSFNLINRNIQAHSLSEAHTSFEIILITL